MYYIGVDLGTSSVKIILMEASGNIVNTVSKSYPIDFPKPGWSEQNPYDWYDKTCEGIRELVAGYNKDDIAGISFGGQMHGLVILDEDDNVIRPAILWNDGRTTKECDYLNNVIGKYKLTEYTANIAFAGFTAPKLLWVEENEPQNFKKIAKIMLPKDYIAYRFTGVHCTDVSDASGMLLLDVKNRDWSDEMIRICGITRKQLPKLYESYEKVGCLTKEAADTLGLTDKVIVAAGAGDNAAAAVVEIQADSQVRDVMLTDVHNGADVFSFPDDQIISLTAGGVLTEVPNADEIAAANVKESVEAATLNDTLYGYPMTADNGYFMYYNKDYFSEDDVKSLDKMLSIAAANNKKVAMEFNSGWYLYTFFGNTGLSLSIKPDGITNECNWNSQTGDITGVAIKQALDSIAANPGFISMPNGDIAEHIKSGDVIAGISGVWDVMNVKEAWGENYGACKLPTYTVAGKEVQMSSFTGYKMMGVNAYSKNKEWACRLADWLTNQQNQELRFKERNQGPSNSKASESGEIKKVAAIQAIIAQSQYGTLQRVGNSYWDACKKFANTVLSGNNGGLSDQEVMDTLVNEITASAVK